MIYESVLRPILFRLWNGDPERAHEAMMHQLKKLGQGRTKRLIEDLQTVRSPSLERDLFGIRFRNPVGLAGGFDKNAVAIGGFEAMGFGFLEIGTITRHPQPGNPKPRVFRLPADKAVINRFGFNNDGADAVADRLRETLRNPDVPLGISLGKSKITPLVEAVEDYLYSFRTLHNCGQYFAVNVSSPNTPGLRQLQDKSALDELLAALIAEAAHLATPGTRRKPILLKIAPDLELPALDEVLEVCSNRGVDGIIATNTTLSREGLRTAIDENGGLSGRPLFRRAVEVVSHIRTALPAMPIVGVGGIMSAPEALQMIDAGAQLVQVYTGLIYRGPGLVREINRAILTRSRTT
jgi:dihydroorotate dehydrogenase